MLGLTLASILVVFTFADVTQSIDIPVPMSELVLPWLKSCRFVLQPNSRAPLDYILLGNSFLGSLHMVVDYDDNTVRIAKAQHHVASTQSSRKSEL